MSGPPPPLRRLFLWQLVAVGLCVLARPSAAQRFHVRTYTEIDGLPSPTIRDLVQDATGCIWIATRAGAACYDGSRWTTFGTGEGLPDEDLGQLLVDGDGTPWSLTFGSPVRVASFRDGVWEQVGDELRARGNVIAAASIGAGREFNLLAALPDGRLEWFDGRSWTHLEFPEDGPDPRRIYAVERVRDAYWIGTRNGLFRYEPGAFGPERLESPFRDVRGVAWDREADRVWVVSMTEIALLDEDLQAVHRSSLELTLTRDFNVFMRVEPDRHGGVYFGNHGGAFTYSEADGLRELDVHTGLITPGLTALLMDREDNLWVASRRGITKIITRRFDTYRLEHGLAQDEVTVVMQRRDGTMVLGHPGAITVMEDPPVQVELSKDLHHGRVFDVVETSDGTLWIAAAWVGLIELPVQGPMRVHGPEQGLDGSVMCVAADEEDRLWVGLGHEIRVQSEEGVFEPALLGLDESRQHTVRRIVITPDGDHYAATNQGGVLHWRRGQRAWSYGSETELLRSVYAVLQRRDGDLWAGTARGVALLRDGELVPSEEIEIERPVYFLTEDAKGRVWIGSNDGVHRWDGTDLRHFGVMDGVAGPETNRAGGFLDADDRMWIGTNLGVSVYREEFDTERRAPPTVEITSVVAGDAVLPATQPIRLKHSRNHLAFEFRAISFTDESRVTFRTRLEGLENEWREPISLPYRQVHYAGLPPGEYRFQIQATDVEGRRSELVTSAPVIIRGPFWLQAWFQVAAVVALVALLLGGVAYRNKTRYAQRLVEEVRSRTAELQRSEEATTREKQRLAITLGNITEGVVALDWKETVVLWNPAAEAITGFREEEARGRKLRELLKSGELCCTDGPRRVRVTVASGEARTFEISGAAIHERPNTTAGTVLAFRDVTERLAAERKLAREEKLEALGLLAGGIAHDFNNLLTVILGNLSMAADEDLDEEVRSGLHDARAAARRARSLTEQLLTFSKGGEPVRQSASITELLYDSSSFVLSGSNARCELDVAEDLRLAHMDEGQISQVVHNLLINARQAMPEGGTIHVTARNVGMRHGLLPDREFIEIEVRDEGVGISDAQLEHIFDPYYSTKERGSGLGLAIAHSIIQRHDGLLTVESEVGKGTTFRIYLPVGTGAGPGLEDHVLVPPRKETANILVMDDEEPVRRVVSSILGRMGFRSTCARDGLEAIELYETAIRSGDPFDAVIMDLTIPGGMGGKEAIRRLIELDPGVRAIVASGYSNDPVMAQAEQYGFRADVSKPFGAEELTDVLNRVLT